MADREAEREFMDGFRAAAGDDAKEFRRLDARVAELEEALGRAIDYCDAATHGDDQYAMERAELIRVWRNEY